jgi:hypothetical protein
LHGKCVCARKTGKRGYAGSERHLSNDRRLNNRHAKHLKK